MNGFAISSRYLTGFSQTVSKVTIHTKSRAASAARLLMLEDAMTKPIITIQAESGDQPPDQRDDLLVIKEHELPSLPKPVLVMDGALNELALQSKEMTEHDALLLLQLLVCSGYLHAPDVRRILLSSQNRHDSIETCLIDSGTVSGAILTVARNVLDLLDEHFLTFVQAARCLRQVHCTGDYPVEQAVEELITAICPIPPPSSHLSSTLGAPSPLVESTPALSGVSEVSAVEHRQEWNQGLLRTYSRFVRLLVHDGDFPQPEFLQKRKVERMEAALGLSHPDLIAELTKLAGILCAEDKYPEAVLNLRRIICILDQGKTYNGPQLANYLSMLAGIHLKFRLYDEAEPLLGRALTIRQMYLSSDHPDVHESLHDYAWLLYKTHRDVEAEKLQVQAHYGR